MRSAITPLALLEPKSLREALHMLRHESSPPVTPLAGCTDIYVALNFGTQPHARFMNVWGLRELRGISMRGETLVLGALTTYTDVINSRLVRRHLPMLAAAALDIGGVQIQNRGTLGGNIANASPAGDTLPVFAAADATIVLRNADAERRVPFAEFYTGYRCTVLSPDELIVAIEVPPQNGRQWFRKVGTRAAQAISKVSLAAVRAERPRLALGSVSATVVRLPRTEAVLAADADLPSARHTLMKEIQPIDDLRSSAAYRRRVAANLLEQFWKETEEARD
ncbi:MAG: xanthine dehydrogenase family protein subunit M [Gemmatimonadaceae bacterium]